MKIQLSIAYPHSGLNTFWTNIFESNYSGTQLFMDQYFVKSINTYLGFIGNLECGSAQPSLYYLFVLTFSVPILKRGLILYVKSLTFIYYVINSPQ